MSGCHVLVECVDGIRSGELSELLVHVVCAGARVVLEPNTEVLDLQGPLLGNLCGEVDKGRTGGDAVVSIRSSDLFDNAQGRAGRE